MPIPAHLAPEEGLVRRHRTPTPTRTTRTTAARTTSSRECRYCSGPPAIKVGANPRAGQRVVAAAGGSIRTTMSASENPRVSIWEARARARERARARHSHRCGRPTFRRWAAVAVAVVPRLPLWRHQERHQHRRRHRHRPTRCREGGRRLLPNRNLLPLLLQSPRWWWWRHHRLHPTICQLKERRSRSSRPMILPIARRRARQRARARARARNKLRRQIRHRSNNPDPKERLPQITRPKKRRSQRRGTRRPRRSRPIHGWPPPSNPSKRTGPTMPTPPT